MTTLRKAAPNFVPKVVGWGELKSAVVKSYFLLVEFKHFVPGLPDPVKLGECVAGLHQSPEAVSPTGQFGFPIQTFDGARLQYVGWESSWAVFFSKMLAEVYRQDIEENGVWTELDAVFQRVQRQLIPRLLGALESDGRSITPVLIHGDMWEGNVGTEADTGNLWTYDCAAYYAHNEMELGIWRAERHELRDKAYRRQYMLRVEPSEPEEEMDDRIRLYSAKTNLIFSACFPGNPSRYQSVHTPDV
jgi:fructosamine-3-kinase